MIDDGLRPSEQQYERFAEHLLEAHSWYKHLPLLTGGHFVVFLSEHAGTGRKVVSTANSDRTAHEGFVLVTPSDGSEFTDENPRLHYSWKTTKEYRNRFGYLDYMWRLDGEEHYCRDAGPPFELPSQVEQHCSFVLYPYASGQFVEAVTWSHHAESLEQLRVGGDHPAQQQVLELADLALWLDSAENALSEENADLLASHDWNIEQALQNKPTSELRELAELETKVNEAADRLSNQELAKVRGALRCLDQLLDNPKS